MISKDSNPVAWATLMYELEDAKEHLGDLISALNTNSEIDEVEYSIGLGHVFSHLNRAWHRRQLSEDFSDEQRHAASQFPTDLKPL